MEELKKRKMENILTLWRALIRYSNSHKLNEQRTMVARRGQKIFGKANVLPFFLLRP